VLEEILEHMLNDLRQFYKKENHNLVYLIINQSEMDSVMNSPAFEISNTSNQIILSNFLGIFNRFFRSNASLRLQKDFSVYFCVLSAAHVNDPTNKRGDIARKHFSERQRQKLGCASESETEIISRSGYFEIPLGYPFKNLSKFAPSTGGP
jgi:hypothetical protein